MEVMGGGVKSNVIFGGIIVDYENIERIVGGGVIKDGLVGMVRRDDGFWVSDFGLYGFWCWWCCYVFFVGRGGGICGESYGGDGGGCGVDILEVGGCGYFRWGN